VIRIRDDNRTRSRWPGLAILVWLALVSACAVVEPPPGGPVDSTPAHVVSVYPDSGLTGLGEVSTLRIRFSEKMDRQGAVSWLFFFPDQRIRKTKWHGATEAEVFLEAPLPADTLIVVEIAGGMRDAHKVRNKQSRRFPLATTDSLFTGLIGGILLLDDGPVTNGVVELYGLQPDSVEYFQRDLLRRTTTDETGSYYFQWLPVPSGPYLVRAFADEDGNLRPGDKDAKRLVPDTLSLDDQAPTVTAGVTTLFAWDTPGRLICAPFDPPQWDGQVRAWSMAVGAADTGWVPVPEKSPAPTSGDLFPGEGGTLMKVTSGLNRVVAFVDLDNDSTFSAIPDSLLVPVAPDQVRWFLEPFQVIENVELEAGLFANFSLTAFGDTLQATEAPEVVVPDSLAALVGDTLSVDLPDSLQTPAPE